MKICDRCNCETKELTQLHRAFSGMEVCQSCYNRLWVIWGKADDRVQKFRRRLQDRAIEEWKSEYATPAKVVRAQGVIASIIRVLMHGPK